MTDATATERPPLPCPFCNKVAPNLDTTPLGYAFRCLTCNARGPVRPTREAARGAWDRRSDGPAGPGTAVVVTGDDGASD